MSIDFLSELNDAQRAAVECCDCSSMVIAGAGSGKTRVLTYKIAFLLQQGYEPWEILALTFTNKAADEMKQRIAQLVGADRTRYLWMGTFHSIFARILRVEHEAIGYAQDYTIYDTQDSQSLIKRLVKELGLDEKKYKATTVASRISEAKNNMVGAREYALSRPTLSRDDAAQMKEIYNIYTKYEEALRRCNAMDFDDLLMKTYLLFREHPEICAKYQQRFRFVLVDEYQDTNRVQHMIVRQLTERNQRVCVVGDDAQCIYSFRGAVIDNMLNFQKMYKGIKLFKLERNYRSTRTIVGAANSIIQKNVRQINKSVYSEKDDGELIEVCEAYSDKEEANIVCRKITELKRTGCGLDRIAILYRTNSQSRVFEEEFRRFKLNYRIIGGLSFYQRKEIKDAVAYLKLCVNPDDETSLRRIINVPARGIGNVTIEKIAVCAARNGVSMGKVVEDPESYGLDVNKGTAARLMRFADLLRAAREKAKQETAHTVAAYLFRESGLWAEVFSDNDPEAEGRQENLQELADGLCAFVSDNKESGLDTSLATYLQDISLATSADTDTTVGEAVTLMTVHAAKGLEYGTVFVVGLEENLFPSAIDWERQNIEEERRLFYVAVTRAEERLFLTWSHSRFRNGQFENHERSRFVDEIDHRFLSGGKRQRSLFASARKERPSEQTSLFSPSSMQPRRTETYTSSASVTPTRMKAVRSVTSSYTAQAPLPEEKQGFRTGQTVEHARFGRGKVLDITGSGLDTKIKVNFEHFGEKTLMMRFANIKVVE